jgi:hypothetical protein
MAEVQQTRKMAINEAVVQRSWGRWVVVFGVAMLGGIAWLAYGYRLRQQAEAVLADVRELTLASDRSTTFVALKQKYGSALQFEGCVQGFCSYQLAVSNHLLSAFHLARYTELNVTFTLRNDVLGAALIEYRSAQTNATSPVAHLQADFSCTEPCDYVYVHPWNKPTSERWNGVLQLGRAANPALMSKAFSLNTTCLTKIGGCSDLAELLPTVWQRLGPNGLACILPNREGTVVPLSTSLSVRKDILTGRKISADATSK